MMSSIPISNLVADRDGYPSLAKWIAQDPDSETFIFRRFNKLSARNILHLQSQLIELEARQERLDEELRQDTNLEARQSLRRWERFIQRYGDPLGASPSAHGGQLAERAQLVIDVQTKLKEYRECNESRSNSIEQL